MSRDPRVLQPLGRWEGLVRGRFEARLDGSTFVVDAHYLDLDERIRLYRDGRLVAAARRRARFRLGHGTEIEAAVAKVGMKYARLRREGSGSVEPLRPVEGTAEAWRARLGRDRPRLSAALDRLAPLVLLAVLVVEVPQLVNLLGVVAPVVGLPGFRVPVLALPGWAHVAVALAAGAAALERSLSMRYHPLLDD